MTTTRHRPQRILLIKPSSLGDVVHALPVLHALRKRFPDARVDWLIATPFAPLLEGHPDIHELVPFDRHRYGRIGRSWSATRDFVRFLRTLRRKHYDTAIDLQGLFRSGFFARASGARTRIGFRDAREGAALFYTHKIAVPDHAVHAVDRNLATLKPLADASDAEQPTARFSLPVCPDEQQAATRLLDSHQLGNGRHFLAVLPGARWATKIWPAGKFAEVVDGVHEATGMRTVLLGGPDERDACRAVAAASQSEPLDLSGQTSIPGLTSILRRAACVVCHDSGPMHLAVACDRPLVCISGPTNPVRTGPYRRLDDVVRLDLPCSPCYFRRLSQCPHDHRCMADLSAETVLDAVLKRLQKAVA